MNVTEAQKPRSGMNMGHKPVSPPAILSSQSSPRLHLLLLFLLLASSGLSYEVGDFRQCRSAPFVPGYNLVGESVDAATYERKGVHPVDTNAFSRRRTCLLYRNPYQGNQLQKVPFSASVWKPEPHCSTQVTAQTHSSASSLIEELKSQDIYNWKVGLSWKFSLNVGGEFSELYHYGKSRNREDQYTYSSYLLRCSFYRHAVRAKPLNHLSKAFENEVKNLPRYYNSATKDKYRNFIRTYGTHYIHQVSLGGQIKRIAATRKCLSRLNGFSTRESQRCLSLDLNVGLGLAKVNINCNKFLRNSGMKAYYFAGLYEEQTEAMGGNGWSGRVSIYYRDPEGYRKWQESLKHIPVIVKFSLKPLWDLMNDAAKSGLRDAINDYIKDITDTDTTVLDSPRSCTLPSHYADCCPKTVGKGWLKVTIIRARDLKGDVFSVTEGYIEMSYGNQFYKTKMIESNNPTWDVKYDLGWVDTGEELKMELKDDDGFRREVLLSCSYDMTAGSYKITCRGDNGMFEAKYTLFCGPHLTGDYCDIYEPY